MDKLMSHFSQIILPALSIIFMNLLHFPHLLNGLAASSVSSNVAF